MTEEGSRYIKKCLYTIALFFILFLILAAVHYFTAPFAEERIREAVSTVAAQQKEKLPKPGERTIIRNAGWSYAYAFRADGNKDSGIFYALRITGNSGPYTGIFYSSEKSGTFFCGLSGVPDASRDASYYGITERIITMWIHKLDNLSKDAEAKK